VWAADAADWHQDTPRIRRRNVTLVLVRDELGQIPFIVKAAQSEDDAILSSQEEVHTSGPTPCDGYHDVEKLFAITHKTKATLVDH